MGKLSPVKDDWETNKSLDWIKRKSAGIISPADSWTKSPHTTSSIGISICFLSRMTVAVTLIIFCNFSTALLDLTDWTKLIVPLKMTIANMINTPVTSFSSGAA